MTMREYLIKCEGHRIRQSEAWFHTKIIAFTTYRMLGGKDKFNSFLPEPGAGVLSEQQKEEVKAIAQMKNSIKERYKHIIGKKVKHA